MNGQMVEIVKDVINNYKSTKSYKCKYCERSFVKESTLLAHMCEPKRRWEQKNEKHIQLGLQAYLYFFKQTQSNSTNKGYKDFIGSNYYNAFCKFGKFMLDYKIINTQKYIEYVINSKFKLDHWCKEQYYLDWLGGYLKTEHWEDALTRSLNTMETWADTAGVDIKSYFIANNKNKIVQDIINGRISPWVIFSTETGKECLGKLNEEQVQLVYPYIDPDYWRQHLIKFNKESKIVKDTLKEVGF